MLSRDQTKVLFFGVSFGMIFILGYWGYALALPDDSFLDMIYYSLQLFVLQPASKEVSLNIPLNVARFAAPFLLASSTISLFLFTSGRKAREILGLRLKDHVLILGEGDLAIKQALQFRNDNKHRKVVLVSDGLNEENIRELELRGIQVYSSEQNGVRTVRKFKTHLASTIVLMFQCVEHNRSLLLLIQEHLKTGRNSGSVLILVQGLPDNEAELRAATAGPQRTLGEVLKEGPKNRGYEVIYFDPYQMAAQMLLTDFGPHVFTPQIWGTQGERPHVVVFGLSALAKSWIQVVLANCHYHPDQKLRVTIFYDRDREEKAAHFYRTLAENAPMQKYRLEKVEACRRESYPEVPEDQFRAMAELHATRIFDIHLEPLSMEALQSDAIEDVFRNRIAEGEQAAVYICQQDDDSSLGVARTLAANYQFLEKIIAKCVVCIQDERSASRQLHHLGSHSDFMMVFPMEEALRGDMHSRLLSYLENCAAELHNAYLRDPDHADAIYGTKSFLLWEHLAEEKKASNRNGVLHFFVKAFLFGQGDARTWNFDFLRGKFKEQNELLARLEHQRWEAHHFAEAWRLGCRVDSAKMHPALVPYNWLSEKQKSYDRYLITAVLDICEQYREKGI